VNLSPIEDIAALLVLIPLFAGALISDRLFTLTEPLPRNLRLSAPGILVVPYLLVAVPRGMFEWRWFFLYLLMPMGVAGLLWLSGRMDPTKRGTWLDFAVLATLGVGVDLQFFQKAWPPDLVVFGKMLVFDAAFYGFLLVRRLEGVGFDLRLRWRDITTGVREFVFYAPFALLAGWLLHFRHPHLEWPQPGHAAFVFAFTFFFIAIPEELFFRGWVQNLLENRMGRWPALVVTSLLYGFSHFNKLTGQEVNWKYILLTTVAGVFYGRAWRRDRRVAAAVITHTIVETLWLLLLL
jgi:membrane protease YdiL (CAAX protease family)